jgi:hypothetical protein
MATDRVLELVGELGKWYGRIISTEKQIPDNRLYHYTTLIAFREIIGSNQFRMTSYQYLNDETEFVHSDHLIKTSICTYKNRFRFMEEYFLQRYLGYNSTFGKRVAPFVFSLSEDGDSLPQWRAYGDDGKGIMIGIEPPRDGKRYYRNLSKVTYDPLEQQSIMNRIFEEYFEICSHHDYSERESLNVISNLYEMIMRMRVYLKNSSFASEKEWRYANYPRTGHSSMTDAQVEENKYFFEGRIRDENGLLPIRDIVLGRKVDEKEMRLEVSDLLTEHGYDVARINIRRSTVPMKDVKRGELV